MQRLLPPEAASTCFGRTGLFVLTLRNFLNCATACLPHIRLEHGLWQSRLDQQGCEKLHLPELRISYQSVGGWSSAIGEPNRYVCLPLQRADRSPGEAGCRDRRHEQAKQRLRRLWLSRSMRPMRQGAGVFVARHGLRTADQIAALNQKWQYRFVTGSIFEKTFSYFQGGAPKLKLLSLKFIP
jgi:hypothetical protein